jgi:hypothetical protein
MPHLTAADGRPRADTPYGAPPGGGWGRLGIGLPGWGQPLRHLAAWTLPAPTGGPAGPPAPVQWAGLRVPGGPDGRPDGPGGAPDRHCLDAAARLTAAGVRVLGHLDLADGTRSYGDLVAEAHRHLEWYGAGGFLLDRCPAGRESLPAVRRLTATLDTMAGGRGPGGGGGHLVLVHGRHPHPGFADTADQLVTFCGPWTDYRWSQAPEWTADHPPERFAHFVHGVPRTHLDEAIRVARWQGAGTIFFTDRTPSPAGPASGGPGRGDPGEGRLAAFGTPPGYWDEIVSRIGPGVSE